MLSYTAKLFFIAFLTCYACLTNAQFNAEVMLLPETAVSEIESAASSSSILFKNESLKANGSVKIEASSPEELLAFLEHEKGIGLLKAFFSLTKYPDLQERFKAVSYDTRKAELLLEQQPNEIDAE